ncbi:MAG: CoA transferase [Deltaproteobacteria bacterium]|nr:CoA transferase [Deltaproteobacteria bacterium]
MALLSDITVLDFTRVLAGPYATMTLADFGARVIKVEPPGGEETRAVGECFVAGTAVPFLMVNRGKQSVCVDLRAAEAREIVRRLVARSQVVVHSFRAEFAAEIELDYDSVRRIRPDVVYGAISGYGDAEEHRGKPALDTVVQALAGLMYASGEEGDPPVRIGVPVVDLSAGMATALGLVAAILAWQRTGQGQRLDVSLLDAVLGFMLLKIGECTAAGREPRREANLPAVVPSRHFQGADGRYLSVTAFGEKFFRRLAAIVGRPEWLADPRFSTNAARVRNRYELTAALAEAFRRRPAAQWLRELEAAGIPCAPVQTVSEALADPAVARALAEHPALRGVRLVRAPVRLPDGMRGVEEMLPPPAIGEHTAAVLREAGFSQPQIEALAAREVIRLGAAGEVR